MAGTRFLRILLVFPFYVHKFCTSVGILAFPPLQALGRWFSSFSKADDRSIFASYYWQLLLDEGGPLLRIRTVYSSLIDLQLLDVYYVENTKSLGFIEFVLWSYVARMYSGSRPQCDKCTNTTFYIQRHFGSNWIFYFWRRLDYSFSLKLFWLGVRSWLFKLLRDDIIYVVFRTVKLWGYIFFFQKLKYVKRISSIQVL